MRSGRPGPPSRGRSSISASRVTVRAYQAIAAASVAATEIPIKIAHKGMYTDAIAKMADVEVLESTPICPGKYMVLVGGDVNVRQER